MKTYYEESDMVSFGLYLLSTKRNENILKNHEHLSDKDGITQVVYDADLANWKYETEQINLATKPSDLA